MTTAEQLNAAFMADDKAAVCTAAEAALSRREDVATALKSVRWFFRPWLLLQSDAEQETFAKWCFERTSDHNPIIHAEAAEKQGGWQQALEASRLMAVAEEHKTMSCETSRA
ncbi:MAG: hypothetical protein ACI8RZ_001406, partial [Myxococcota bacterium]